MIAAERRSCAFSCNRRSRSQTGNHLTRLAGTGPSFCRNQLYSIAPVICFGKRQTGQPYPTHQSLAHHAISRRLPLQAAPGISTGPFEHSFDQVVSGRKRNDWVERSMDHGFGSNTHHRNSPSRTRRATLADRGRSPLVSKWTSLKMKGVLRATGRKSAFNVLRRKGKTPADCSTRRRR